MRGFVEHLIGFPEFNKFNNTGAEIQDSIYHTLKLHFISEFCTKTSQLRH